MHPIINVLQNAENLITPMAARFLCHQAYINKVDLEAVDLQVLDICRSVQTQIRILAGDTWSNTDALEEMMECYSADEYLANIDNIREVVEVARGAPIEEAHNSFFQFLIAFSLQANGEYFRPEVTIQDLADVYTRFGTSLLDITDADVPVHGEVEI